MDILTQEFLAPSVEKSEKSQKREVDTTPFPLWWLAKSKRNIEGLREIAAHLDTQMGTIQSSPSGVKGEATEVEKQIIRLQSNNANAIAVLAEVVQSSLLIIADNEERRFSQRSKRAIVKTWANTKSIANRVWESPVFKVLGALSTIAFAYTMLSRFLGK
jgi:hypothetical protein